MESKLSCGRKKKFFKGNITTMNIFIPVDFFLAVYRKLNPKWSPLVVIPDGAGKAIMNKLKTTADVFLSENVTQSLEKLIDLVPRIQAPSGRLKVLVKLTNGNNLIVDA